MTPSAKKAAKKERNNAVANNGIPFEIKRDTTSPFATTSEEGLLEKLSVAREHSTQGKQSDAKSVISDMSSKYGL